MRASYRLLDEPWIPVVDLTGTKKQLGIRALLEQAHLLREISDPSPLVEYGLYRLLVVFLMDALRPQDVDDLEDLLNAGQFDREAIDRYIALCRDEGVTFDLFDKDRPFLQTPFNETWDKQVKPVSILDYTVPSGNNHVHFDHRSSEEIAFSYAQAAKLLPAVQMFCTAGAQSYPSGVNGAPPYFILIRGHNLFETLLYALLGRDDIKFDDPPVIWRSRIPVEPKKPVIQTSWIYGMLFPARRVLLIPDETCQVVRQVYLSQGMNYTAADIWTDPHTAYRINAKGRFPWRPNREKAIWRSLNELAAPNQTPKIVSQYKNYFARSGSSLLHLLLYGVQTDQASYIAAMRHDFRLPTAIIENPDASEWIKDAIAWAEKLAGTLQYAMKHPDIPPQTISQALQTHYDRCGQTLMTVCDTKLTEDGTDFEALYRDWIGKTSQYAIDALNEAMQTVSLRGKSLMEVTNRHGMLFAEIKKKEKEVKQ